MYIVIYIICIYIYISRTMINRLVDLEAQMAPFGLRQLNDLCVEIQRPRVSLTQKDAFRDLTVANTTKEMNLGHLSVAKVCEL